MLYTKPTRNRNDHPAVITGSDRTVCSHAQARAQPGYWELAYNFHEKVALLKVEDPRTPRALVDESYAFPKNSLPYFPVTVRSWEAARNPFKGWRLAGESARLAVDRPTDLLPTSPMTSLPPPELIRQLIEGIQKANYSSLSVWAMFIVSPHWIFNQMTPLIPDPVITIDQEVSSIHPNNKSPYTK